MKNEKWWKREGRPIHKYISLGEVETAKNRFSSPVTQFLRDFCQQWLLLPSLSADLWTEKRSHSLTAFFKKISTKIYCVSTGQTVRERGNYFFNFWFDQGLLVGCKVLVRPHRNETSSSALDRTNIFGSNSFCCVDCVIFFLVVHPSDETFVSRFSAKKSSNRIELFIEIRCESTVNVSSCHGDAICGQSAVALHSLSFPFRSIHAAANQPVGSRSWPVSTTKLVAHFYPTRLFHQLAAGLNLQCHRNPTEIRQRGAQQRHISADVDGSVRLARHTSWTYFPLINTSKD